MIRQVLRHFSFRRISSTSRIPSLKEFIKKDHQSPEIEIQDLSLSRPMIDFSRHSSFFIQTYGCQMNVSDSEIVNSILKGAGFSEALSLQEADIILANTCAIRENAEKKVQGRLHHYNAVRKEDAIVGVLGCMAERLKTVLLQDEKLVQLVAGPDAYRDLPRLISVVQGKGEESIVSPHSSAINVQLSLDQTYADVTPVRRKGQSAWVSIMRGCNNMCSFCIVPFTRGRQRSRPVESIIRECKELQDAGFKQLTLLGQNVNSFHDRDSLSEWSSSSHLNSEGFTELYKARKGEGVRFAELLARVAQAVPEMRVRFTSPHPKDFPDPVLDVIASCHNLCKQIHLPAQSGSTAMLTRMRRNHTREAYLELVQKIRSKLPGVALSSDFICGFCDESEQQFNDTLSLIRAVKYDMAYLFAYSMREKTHAHRRMEDNVSQEVKQERLQEMIRVFKENQAQRQKLEVGRTHLVLVDGPSKKSKAEMAGLTDTAKRTVFPQTISNGEELQPGDWVEVAIRDFSHNTLIGRPLRKTSLKEWSQKKKGELPFLEAKKFEEMRG